MDKQARFARLESEPFRDITATSRTFSGSLKDLAEIFRHREMLALFVRRDIKGRYTDSALGLVWTLIKPITQLIIYVIVVGQFLGAARGIPDFAIYVFAGLTGYGLFSEIVSGATASIVTNSGLIKKVYVPREVFPLASVGAGLFGFLIQLGILILATIVLRRFPWSTELLMAIPSVLVLVVYGAALGLFLSAVNVYLRDVQYLIEVVLLVMLWASPVLYSWTMAREALGPFWIEVYSNNPITLAILGFQRAFWVSGHDTPYPDNLLLRLGIALAIGLVLLFFSQRAFARLQGNFAQEL